MYSQFGFICFMGETVPTYETIFSHSLIYASDKLTVMQKLPYFAWYNPKQNKILEHCLSFLFKDGTCRQN